jgi:predicted ribosome quality control (RQC) complex YloA/Tae2 family protein
MVKYYRAKDGTLMYMGKDKFENEDLIKWGWPEDVWFHVDNLSSAHVYVRLSPGQTMGDISDDTVRDCAQLVKANSIEGVKKLSVVVIYTPWANLRKDGSMAVRGRLGAAEAGDRAHTRTR